MTDVVALVSGAERMLAEAETVLDFKDIRDQGLVADNLAQVLGLGKAAQNRCRAVVFKAERGLAAAVKAGQYAGTIATHGGDRTQDSVRNLEDAAPRPATFDELGITPKDVHRGKQLADVTDEQIDAAAEEATNQGRVLTRPQITSNSGQFEFYTPRPFIDAAVATMGGIDLDPASSEIANRTVGAARIWTAEDNGLTKTWDGRIWLNPPFARGLVQQFIDRLIEETAAGRVTASIVLTNNATETGWGQTLLAHNTAVCLPRGRINFNDHTGRPRTESGALQGQMIVYRGDHRGRFAEAFAPFGVIL